MTKKEDSIQMTLREEVNLHTHQITELQNVTEMLRERMMKNAETMVAHSYIMQDVAKICNETAKMQKETREIVDKINVDIFSKRTLFEFASEKLTQPKFLVLLFLALESYTLFPIVFKHFTGW
jgi:hypothetical protein